MNFNRNLWTHKVHTSFSIKKKKKAFKNKGRKSLTFQKRLESWNFLQFYDIGIIADIPGGLCSWGYHHNIVHFCSLLGW